GIIGSQRLLRLLRPFLRLREVVWQIPDELIDLRHQWGKQQPADTNEERRHDQINEDRAEGTRHAQTLKARYQRANRLGEGNSEEDQEKSAEGLCDQENQHQRRQRDTCRQPERTLREGDGEATRWVGQSIFKRIAAHGELSFKW